MKIFLDIYAVGGRRKRMKTRNAKENRRLVAMTWGLNFKLQSMKNIPVLRVLSNNSFDCSSLSLFQTIKVFLDITGRPVLVLKAKNLVQNHIQVSVTSPKRLSPKCSSPSRPPATHTCANTTLHLAYFTPARVSSPHIFLLCPI